MARPLPVGRRVDAVPWEPTLDVARIAEVRAAFSGGREEGSDSFFVKLQRQLSDRSDSARELAAELLWILLLFRFGAVSLAPRMTAAEIRLALDVVLEDAGAAEGGTSP